MQLVPTYSTLATTSKIHLIQSLVSRIIVEHIFLAYFVGLSQERSEELENVEKHLSSYGKRIFYCVVKVRPEMDWSVCFNCNDLDINKNRQFG